MSEASRYLSLDMGASTGWCLVEGDKVVDSGVRDFSHRASQNRGVRYIKFQNFLVSMGHVDALFYEEVNWSNNKYGGDGHALWDGLKAFMEAYCAGFGIKAYGIHPATLKKAFAGHGHATKEEMCAAARQMGWQGGMKGTALFHDECDAIAAMFVLLKEHFGVDARF